MSTVSAILPCYSADTAGVCSALYEMGGMTVVHDASGCNSTYATHDEPRWETLQADIYISALTEIDAIMGNDEKFIADVTAAAHDRRPKFIAICGSPMPMMTGTDFDAAAAEIGARTGLRCFAMHTNGMQDYITGAAEALLAVTEEYAQMREKSRGIGVNILGATPLDLGLSGTVSSLRAWLTENGFSVVSCLAVGEINLENVASASVSLVISQTGLKAAKYLHARFGIPYVCGLPVGGLKPVIAEALRSAAKTGTCAYPCANRRPGDHAVIGEGIIAGSIAAAAGGAVLHPLTCAPEIAAPADLHVPDELSVKNALDRLHPAAVTADPLYRYVLPNGTRLNALPHYAFSGRCFANAIPDLIRK